MQEIKTGEEYRQAVLENIARVGWGISGVGTDEVLNRIPYAYSTGLTLKHMPEVIAIGNLPVELLADMVSFVVAISVEEGKFTEGLIDCGMETGGEVLRAYIRPVVNHDLVAQRYAALTNQLYGEHATYWQLLWADGNNVLPTEEGYDASVVQPLL